MDDLKAAHLSSSHSKQSSNMVETFPDFTFSTLNLDAPIKRDIISSQWFRPPGLSLEDEEVPIPCEIIGERKTQFRGFPSLRSEKETSFSSEGYEVISRKDYYPDLSPLPRPEVLSQADLNQPETITQDEDTVLINHPNAESFDVPEHGFPTAQQDPEPLYPSILHQRERVYSLSHAVADLRDLPWHVDYTSCANHNQPSRSPSIHSAATQENNTLQPNDSSQSLLQLIKQQITKLRPGQKKKKSLVESKAEAALQCESSRGKALAEDSLNKSLERLTMGSRAETSSLAESWLDVCDVPSMEEGVKVCEEVAA